MSPELSYSSKMEAAAMLTDCLSLVATNAICSEKGKQQALDMLIRTMADCLAEREEI